MHKGVMLSLLSDLQFNRVGLTAVLKIYWSRGVGAKKEAEKSSKWQLKQFRREKTMYIGPGESDGGS